MIGAVQILGEDFGVGLFDSPSQTDIRIFIFSLIIPVEDFVDRIVTGDIARRGSAHSVGQYVQSALAFQAGEMRRLIKPNVVFVVMSLLTHVG
jgi:hypothetical protein